MPECDSLPDSSSPTIPPEDQSRQGKPPGTDNIKRQRPIGEPTAIRGTGTIRM